MPIWLRQWHFNGLGLVDVAFIVVGRISLRRGWLHGGGLEPLGEIA